MTRLRTITLQVNGRSAEVLFEQPRGPGALDEVGRDLRRAESRLSQLQAGAVTQDLQERIAETLEGMIDAIAK